MEKYYIIGYSKEEIAQGYGLRFMDICSKLWSNNMMQTQDLASRGIPYTAYPVLAYSMTPLSDEYGRLHWMMP
jgi:hypothetical protein